MFCGSFGKRLSGEKSGREKRNNKHFSRPNKHFTFGEDEDQKLWSAEKNIEKAIHFFLFPPLNIDNRFAMKQFSAFSTAAENIRNTRPWKKVNAQKYKTEWIQNKHEGHSLKTFF